MTKRAALMMLLIILQKRLEKAQAKRKEEKAIRLGKRIYHVERLIDAYDEQVQEWADRRPCWFRKMPE